MTGLRTFLADHEWAYNAWNGVMKFFSSIHWPRAQAAINGGIYYRATEADHDTIRAMLKKDYLIILTRRKSHFTTWVIALAAWITTGKPSHYAHALMNVEGDIQNNIDYKLIEATYTGVHYSTFMEVFDCDSICLLKPRNTSLEEWTIVLDAVKKDYGFKYDTLFDILDESDVSCVELIYNGLKKLPGWKDRYAKLVALIEKHGNNLTPQMLYDCDDLDVVWEIRR